MDVGGTIMVKAFVKIPNLQHSLLPNPMSLLDCGDQGKVSSGREQR